MSAIIVPFCGSEAEKCAETSAGLPVKIETEQLQKAETVSALPPIPKSEAERIKKIHKLQTQMIRLGWAGLKNAREQGQILDYERTRCFKEGHGVWQKWAGENLPYRVRTARNYIRIFKNWDLILEHAGELGDLTDAYRFTRLKRAKSSEASKASAEQKTEQTSESKEKKQPTRRDGAAEERRDSALGATEATETDDMVKCFLAKAWAGRSADQSRLELLDTVIGVANEWHNQLLNEGVIDIHKPRPQTQDPASKETAKEHGEAKETGDADIQLKNYLTIQWANCKDELERERFAEVLMFTLKRCKEQLGYA